ncbi:MAG: calcium-binding protein, partial [Arenibacterium sp.]
VLRDTSAELDTTARDILVSRTSVAEMQVALNKAEFAAFDNLKSEVETQFAGRNAVTEPLGETFNDIVGKVNNVLGLFSDAKFEVVQEDFGDFAEIAEMIDKVAEPLSVVANMLRPVEGLLDAVGFLADLVLDPIFDFITGSLGIDKVLDDLSDEITDLLPGVGFLDDLIAEAQAVLDSLRDFDTTNFGIDQWQLDIDDRLYGATVGEALLGPTGFGSNASEILNGDGGDDILDARAGDDMVYGLGGNDIILAGEGNDQVFGGTGTDMVYFDGFFQEYELAKEEGSGKVIVTHVRPEKGTQNEGSTRLDSIEHVVFRNISFTGEELENSIIGGSTLNGTSDDDLMFLNSSGTKNADGQHVANGLGGDDRIFGSTEDDELNGGSGNDILLPGFGDDEANGGAGTDTFQILDGPSNSPTRINLLDGTVFGPEGSDRLSSIENLIVQSGGDHLLRGNDQANNMISADGEDILVGRGGDDFMNSGAEDDYLITGAGRDTVLAGDDNDFIIAAADFVRGERETFDGGRGLDALSYSKDFNTVRDIKSVEINASNAIREAIGELTGEAGSVRIFAGSGRVEKLAQDGSTLAVDRAIDIEQFIGSDKNDTLYGARGDSDTRYSIYGAGGDDTLYSRGASIVSGGKGDDRLIAVADPNGGISGTNFQGEEGFDTLDLRGLGDQRWWFSLDGSISRSIRAFDEDYAGNPRSSGLANTSFNVSGIDEYLLAGGNDLIDHNAGGSAKVTFRTAAGDDEVNHRGGFATIYFGSGDDVANMIDGGIVYGGSGDDRIVFDDVGADNEAHGQDGNDVVILERTKGSADGGAGYDTLAFDLENTAGNDYGFALVDLQAGTARMVEKRSANRFENESVNARIANFEQVIGTEFGDTIEGSGADETLIGREGNDTLSGRSGKDQLFGGEGADSLSGGEDDDRLHGGAGNDRLDGGNGRDTALYSYAAPEGLDGALPAGNFGGVTADLVACS